MSASNYPGEAAKATSSDLIVPTIEASDVHGFDVANLDETASACANFFQYADGGGVARNPVPPAYARWGKFEELAIVSREEAQTAQMSKSKMSHDSLLQ